MSILQALILGLVQGITEFLPISSSGHLVLVETLLGLPVAHLKEFDIAVHLGSLLAIMIFFWREFLKPHLWPLLVLGSVPAAFVGLLFEDAIDAIFRNALAVFAMMSLVGFLFILPEPKYEKPQKLNAWRIFIIGCAQAIAIIPGVSRSGSTIFTARCLGIEREEAAKFSFMLGSIAIAGAGLLSALDTDALSVSIPSLLVGFAAAAISGLMAIAWLMTYLREKPLQVFGFYLIALGVLGLLAVQFLKI